MLWNSVLLRQTMQARLGSFERGPSYYLFSIISNIMNDWNKLYLRAETLLSRLEGLMTADQPEPDWNAATAFRWRKFGHTSTIEPVRQPDRITFDALQGIERQKNLLDQNTYQFVQGHPANNVLLTGARGTGKSHPLKCADEEGDSAFTDRDAFFAIDDLTALSVRGTIGKRIPLIGLGVTLGAGYDRYNAAANFAVRDPSLLTGGTIALSEDDLETSRMSYFANASWTFIIVNVVGEIGVQDGGSKSATSAIGTDALTKGGFFGGFAVRIAL